MAKSYFDDARVTGNAPAPPVTAQTIDDFEDNDLAEYQGSTGPYTTQSTTVHDGTYAAQLVNQGVTGGTPHAFSTSGLANYPEAGDTIQGYVRFSGSGSGNIAGYTFGVQDETTGYWAYLDEDEGIKLATLDFNTVNVTTVSVTDGIWYRMVVEWGAAGSITHTVYDDTDTEVGSVSMTDSSYTSGGFGLHAQQNSQDTWFDTFEII
jgi:hypothetical protein